MIGKKAAILSFSMILVALLAGRGQSEPPPRPQADSGPAPFSFAVVGDNRGESTGEAARAFLKIVDAIDEASPDLLFNTGDMINGYDGEDEPHLRKLWQGYRAAIAKFRCPVYHAPGNHDLFDEVSAKLWNELWGPTYYAVEHAAALFLVLDTETHKGRLDDAQFDWLDKQLAAAGKRVVFVFVHRPLFPVDGHLGSSLDRYPDQRDRLHQLFVKHRGAVKGVFMGHEHLYHFEERDGIRYYITAGGGAPLYAPAEMGGFHHFLLARVVGDDVSVELHKVGGPAARPKRAIPVAAGSLLESWDSGLFWSTWDQSVVKELTSEYASEGKQSLRLRFDCLQYEWPLVFTSFDPPRDLMGIDRLEIDVFVPHGAGDALSVSLGIDGKKSNSAPASQLKPGWNHVAVDVDETWLPKDERQVARQLQWTLSSSDARLASWVALDGLRARRVLAAEAAKTQPRPALDGDLRESWEGNILWGVWNENLRHQAVSEPRTEGRAGLKLQFDLAKFPRPILYARLDPSWDLRGVEALTADAYAPPQVAGRLKVHMALVSEDRKHRSPAMPLQPGWNRLVVDLNGRWLGERAKTAVEQVEWTLESDDGELSGWVVVDNFRAE